MNRTVFNVFILVGVFCITACDSLGFLQSTPTPSALLIFTKLSPLPVPPTIVDHPEPNYGINEEKMILEIAKLGGCAENDHVFRCPPGSELNSLGCEEVDKYIIEYPGLKPYPVFQCYKYPDNPTVDSIRFPGFDVRLPVGPLYGNFTYDGSQFILIKEISDYKSLFAPIDSSNEALSFALASPPDYRLEDFHIQEVDGIHIELGRFGAKYFSQEDDIRQYFTDRIESTYATETENGYLVHLFVEIYSELYAPCCDCKKGTYSVDVLVKPSGETSIIDPGPQLMFAEDECPPEY